MSHVSALPEASSSGLDETAVEAAQYALKTLSDNFFKTDAFDATVRIVGVAAMARIMYSALQHANAFGSVGSVEHFHFVDKLLSLFKSKSKS